MIRLAHGDIVKLRGKEGSYMVVSIEDDLAYIEGMTITNIDMILRVKLEYLSLAGGA